VKKIIPIFLFVLAMATSAQGGIVVLDYGSAGGDSGGGADNATIESLIRQSHADNNATNSETRSDQSVTPASLAYWSQNTLTTRLLAWLNGGTITGLSVGDGNFTVDAYGNVTAKSYTTTRTDAAQYFKLYEATSDGNSSATFAVPAKGTGLAGDIDLTFSKSLSFTGTFTDGKLCTYASSGAVISCNTDAAGTGTMTTVSEEHVEVGDADVTQLNFGAGFDVADNGTIAEITLESTVVQAGVTEITKYQYLPAAWFEDNATAPAAPPAVIDGPEIKARLFADNETSIVLWQVDPEWSAGLKFRVYYSLVANGEANDTAIFRLKGCTVGNSEALTCTAGDPIGVTDELGTDDDANELMITDWSDAVTLTGIAANKLARMTFYRGEDDEAGELNVIGIELKYKAKVSAASDY